MPSNYAEKVREWSKSDDDTINYKSFENTLSFWPQHYLLNTGLQIT